MHVDTIVGRLKTSERLLADSFMLVSDRHSQDAEIRDAARAFAGWSAEHVDALATVEEKYGSRRTTQPAQLRAALFHEPRLDELGLVEDLHDLALLTQNAHLQWIELGQAARAVSDRELEQLCANAIARTKRQLEWATGRIEAISPERAALTTDAVGGLATSAARTPTAAAPTIRARVVPVALGMAVAALAGLKTKRALALVLGAVVLGIARELFRVGRSPTPAPA